MNVLCMSYFPPCQSFILYNMLLFQLLKYSQKKTMNKLIQFKLHFQLEANQKQRILTKELTRALTDLNLKRITNPLPQSKQSNISKRLNSKQFLYICITGMPPLNNQYQDVQVPGEKIVIYPECFHPNSTQQQSKNRLEFAHLEKQAQSLHNLLKNRKDKPLVFIIHSFGTSIMSTLFRLYYQQYMNRVIGIVAIGCYPVTVDHNFSDYVNQSESMSKQYLLKNVDSLFEKHKKERQKLKMPFFKDKYANIAAHIAFGHGLGFSQMFSYNRRWFPILKCFIYGRQDNRIDQFFLSQIALYYCYKRKIENNYEEKAKAFIDKKYGLKVDNAQQRFIFNIDGGKHSIHIQKQFKSTINQIIKEYLSAIEQIFENYL